MEQKSVLKILSSTTRIICLTAIGLSLFRIVYHLINQSGGNLTIVQDDFFYYFITAKNIVHHGKSSFDGITLTNGYHPLWMVAILCIELLSFANDPAFFIGLGVVSAISAFVCYKLIENILEKVFSKSWVIYPSLLFTSLSCTWMLFWGMEVTLTIPLFLHIINKTINDKNIFDNRRKLFYFGIFSSLLILSRLDSVIFICLLASILFFTANSPLKLKAHLLIYYIAGFFLIIIYFIYNNSIFNTFTTVASQAKLLKVSFQPNFLVFKEILASRDGLIATWLLPIALISIAIFKRSLQKSRLLLYLVLFFPVIYFSIFCTFSDWIIFPWYTYMLPIVNGLSIAIILFLVVKVIPLRFVTLFTYASFIIVSLVIFILFFKRTIETTIQWNPHPASIFVHAQKLKEFTDTHPGIYSMGDRAGLTAYLTNKPLIQLEGIIADKKMVEHIKAEDDLNRVLREYNIDFFILSTFSPLDRKSGHYLVEMPSTEQAGMRSKKMKGSFSAEPVFYYESMKDAQLPILVYTYIFKVS